MLAYFLICVFFNSGCTSPRRFLKKHPEYAKIQRDTIIVTRHDTIIARKEVMIRDTIHHFSRLEIGKEYIVRDTLNRVEIRYTRVGNDELQLQGKQLAGYDTLKNAIQLINQRQQVVKVVEKVPNWLFICIIMALFLIFAIILLILIKKP